MSNHESRICDSVPFVVQAHVAEEIRYSLAHNLVCTFILSLVRRTAKMGLVTSLNGRSMIRGVKVAIDCGCK